MATTHELKSWPEQFEAVHYGSKRCEVRVNDRNFQVGDGLHLREWDSKAERYTGRSLHRVVTHITHGGQFGLPPNLCVLSISGPG